MTGGGNGAIKYSIRNSKSFDCKTGITGTLEGGNIEKEAEIVVPLKHFCNFRKTLDMPLTNCEIKLPLTWSENCVLTSKAQIDKLIGTGSDENPQFSEINNPTYATFKITDTKLYVQVVTLSAKDDNNLLEQLKSGFKRTTKWNKCTSEITHQTKTNHVNHLIDPTFIRVNRLFVLLFENEKDRTCFSNYYVPKVETEDFNVLIDGESFFDVPVKNKAEAYKKIMSIGKNNHYTTGNILDYEYFSKNCTLIAIDLRKQMELENPDLRQQINVIGKLEEDKATMFLIIEKSEKTTFEF